ncbi:unnamed protein product [Brassicogethes aeneus]|uniref:Uncharacterized protein n=1 Tax=Brassicogethes aeneus TaxID=1431903 RepID=A0A9P0B459_BRAAE|nr:unnamed protein product [Brassicogethes aeneus]
MAPAPREYLRLIQVFNSRFYKSSIPPRTWLMNSNRNHRGGLPPQYPYYPRRGSNTPTSSLALSSVSAAPNRSRSLDGLLDSEPQLAAAADDDPIPSETTKSCDDLDQQSFESSCDADKMSTYSNNSSDSKRKRNFMDRCVNKVRSLIKK